MQDLTKVEDIAKTLVQEAKEPEVCDNLLSGVESLPIPEEGLLTSTPSPCLTSPGNNNNNVDDEKKIDLSEFEVIDSKKEAKDLTSNVAILSGEFAQPRDHDLDEDDEFDAAFDAIAQESVTKSKLEELEKQFETEDDIFDTTKAEKVLKLASLLDKVEDVEDEDEDGVAAAADLNEDDFEDPFDTSAFDHITGKVEEELDFDSIANRDTSANDEAVEGGSFEDAFGGSAAASAAADEGWAAFGPKKPPPRPAKPPPKRPPPPPAVKFDPASRPETPSVVIKAPSTESIKSWNNSVAENLIRKSEIEAEEALKEEEEEFDPFDTTEFEAVAAQGRGIANYEDPFDTTAAADFLEGEQEQNKVERQEDVESDSSNEEEEVPDPFEVLDVIQRTGKLDVAVLTAKTAGKKQSKDVKVKEEEDEEEDPFDTTIAAKVLPNKGDPFDTSHVSGAPGKAELKALEEELLNDNNNGVKRQKTGLERARPKAADKAELTVKAPEPEPEEEEDPFDTSIVDKVLSGEKEEEEKKAVSVEDDDFDPSLSFQKTKQEQKLTPEPTAASIESQTPSPSKTGVLAPPPPSRAKKVKEDSIDSDDFDPRA